MSAALGVCLAVLLTAGTAVPAARQAQRQSRPAAAPVATYKIVKIYPHDRTAFTQGLVYLDGVLYEGTGLNGQSGIRKVRLETGEVLQQQPLDQKYFGEGIAVWKRHAHPAHLAGGDWLRLRPGDVQAASRRSTTPAKAGA